MRQTRILASHITYDSPSLLPAPSGIGRWAFISLKLTITGKSKSKKLTTQDPHFRCPDTFSVFSSFCFDLSLQRFNALTHYDLTISTLRFTRHFPVAAFFLNLTAAA
jgi:hypothetical protein